MIYLSGVSHPQLPPDIGTIITPNMGNRPLAGRPWAADNGCFSGGFDAGVWLTWLERATVEERSRCLFATAPDVVGDAAATLVRSAPHFDAIRVRGYPVAFVGQDGLTPETTPWDEIDCIFIGGSTAWKVSADAHRLVIAAKERGLWAHMGRVNGWRRATVGELFGCDSADGTYLRTAPDFNLPRLSAWLKRAQENPCLPLLPAV